MRRPPLHAVLLVALGVLVAVPAPAGAIFGGSDATANTNPAMVLVVTETSQCGGTLVSSNKVVTAAHCVVGTSASGIFVAVGEVDRDQAVFPENLTNVSAVAVHPDFDPGSLSSDLAVLTLTTPSTSAPARLVTTAENGLWDAGTIGTVTGWGETGGGAFPTRLQLGRMAIRGNAACQAAGWDPQQFVCAGDETVETCAGDSGGPLLVTDRSSTPVLAGVVVAGDNNPCGTGIPDAFARIGADPLNTWLRERIDATSPRVSGQSPTGSRVSRGASVVATFSEKMTPASINKTTVVLSRLTTNGARKVSDVTVVLRADGLSARLNPFGGSATRLARDARYRVEVTTAARDWTGNRLDQNRTVDGLQRKVWTFRTAR